MIGRDTQYILAESTRTLSLVDNSVAEVDGDNLWLGCGTVDKKGGLCEVRAYICGAICSFAEGFNSEDLKNPELYWGFGHDSGLTKICGVK